MKMWAMVACFCAAASAQFGVPNQSAAPIVKLNVVAKDAQGRPVTDLVREDFQVFEGSKAQRVVSFRRNDQSVKRPIETEPNEYSNRTGTPMTRVTVILFDLLNARFEDRGYMMNQLVPALQQVEACDTLFFYILTLNGELYAVHGIADVDRGTGKVESGRPWTRDIKALLDDAQRELFRLRPGGIDLDTRVRMTYRAFGSLAESVAAAPGRKSLIWISHGVPTDMGPSAMAIYGENVAYSPLLERLTATLDRDGVAVYPVRLPESLVPGAIAEERNAIVGSTPATDGPGLTPSTQDTLQQFAQLTGGHAYMTPDIRGAIAQAMSDARMSYLMEYEPSLGKWDGKYHKIRVSCARKGVKLETKQGYYAFADMAADGDREKAAVQDAAASAFDSTEIGVSARVTRRDAASRGVELAIRVEAGDVSQVQADGVATGRLAVSVAGYLKNGRVETFPVSEFAPKLSGAEREAALRDGVRVTQRLTPKEDGEKLRVMVYDRGSGAVGTVTIPAGR